MATKAGRKGWAAHRAGLTRRGPAHGAVVTRGERPAHGAVLTARERPSHGAILTGRQDRPPRGGEVTSWLSKVFEFNSAGAHWPLAALILDVMLVPLVVLW